jgi:hypothetical protein
MKYQPQFPQRFGSIQDAKTFCRSFFDNCGVDLVESTHFSGSPADARRLPVVFSRLQHAVAAADYGSFRQAARALSMKQSTLSRAEMSLMTRKISSLENANCVLRLLKSLRGRGRQIAGRH